MDSIRDGGAAFPTVVASPHDFPDGSRLPMGMSLRDWLAAQALHGLLVGRVAHIGHTNVSEWGRAAYDLADAMLKARGESDG